MLAKLHSFIDVTRSSGNASVMASAADKLLFIYQRDSGNIQGLRDLLSYGTRLFIILSLSVKNLTFVYFYFVVFISGMTDSVRSITDAHLSVGTILILSIILNCLFFCQDAAIVLNPKE